MRKIITLLAAVTISLHTYAQCPVPPCASPIDLTGLCMNNQNYNGDQCFQNGYLNNSNNINNWNNLTFDDVSVSLPLNMNGVCNIHSSGSSDYSYISMNGNDNMYVQDHAVVYTFISNNSTGSQTNYVTLVNGGQLYYSNQYWVAGDTIYLPGNNSNKIVVVACTNIALPITIKLFEKRNGYLVWDVDREQDKIELQYAGNAAPNDFRTFRIFTEEQGKFPLDIGFFRLKVGLKYSKIIEYSYLENKQPYVMPGRIGIYDLYGRKLTTEPYDQVYIKDGKKMPARIR